MNILITGGAGFIGLNLCCYLLDNHPSNKIICLDNLLTGSLEQIQLLEIKYPDRLKFILANIIDYDLEEIGQNVDQIYHLACPASPKSYQKFPIETAKTSFIGTLRLLEYAKKYNIRILFTSTSEIYGDPLEHPQRESYWGNVNPIGIRSCYDEGKRIAETLMFDFHRHYRVDIRVVRLFNTYGPKMASDDGRVISNFITQALSNNDLTIYGDGQQTRSCCYVSDTIDGLYKFMNQNALIGPVNLGNPEEITIEHLAQLILKLLPTSKSIIKYYPLPSDDPKVRKPDISQINTIWHPKIPLENGLLKTIEYFKNYPR